jgi:hypothetical protein
MNTIQEIKLAITQLPLQEWEQLRDWLDEFDAQVWDRQLETDVRAGKLDALGKQAISDFKAGKYHIL